MTDTPLQKHIGHLGRLIKIHEKSSSPDTDKRGFNRVVVGVLTALKLECESLLPEEKQAIDDAIKSEAAREYWEGQKSDAVEFADFIKADYSPMGNELWMKNAKNYKRGDIPDAGQYTTEELYQLVFKQLPAPPNQ